MNSKKTNNLISVENAQEIIFSKFKKLETIKKKLIDSISSIIHSNQFLKKSFNLFKKSGRKRPHLYLWNGL